MMVHIAGLRLKTPSAPRQRPSGRQRYPVDGFQVTNGNDRLIAHRTR